MRIGVLLGAIVSALSMASPAPACSVPASYRVPSTLELVERADAIALVRVEDGGPSTVAGFRNVRLVPFAALKGAIPQHEISFEDAVLSNEREKAVASDPRNLVDANPQAFDGGCNRYVFDKGMIVVAFLKRVGNDLVPDGAAFARTLEDVPSPDALWVKAVKIYVKIAALPKYQRRKEMERQSEILSYQIEDPDARLLAHELQRALSERSK